VAEAGEEEGGGEGEEASATEGGRFQVGRGVGEDLHF